MPVTLTATGSSTTLLFQWSNDSLGTSITVAPKSTTVYTVNVKDIQSGCTASDNVTVTVKQYFPASNTFTICKGQSVTIQAPEGINYLWSTSDTTRICYCFSNRL